MNGRDREALSDILGVLDRALGFPITNLQTLEETDYLQDALIRCLEVIGEATKHSARRQGCVNLLESEGWVRRLISPQFVGAFDFPPPLQGRLDVELPELVGRNRVHCNWSMG